MNISASALALLVCPLLSAFTAELFNPQGPLY